jgi:uncharacterized protein YuzE
VQLTYDEATDALYVYFSQAEIARSEELTPSLIVDYDHTGNVRGVEILDASKGIELERVPHREDLARLLDARNFPVFA